MYAELYCFLISHKELNVPGIGTFLLEKKSARADFLNKCVHPPVYCFSFQTLNNSPSKKLFSWLADALNISDRDAVVRFNDFAFDLKKKIDEGSIVKWKGVGILEKKENQIKFWPEESIAIDRPVTAEKIIRENVEHTMLVGERERTSTEMLDSIRRSGEQWFHRTEKKVFRWWIVALILGILLVGFIGWHFSENGWNVTSVGNQQKI